MWTGHRAGMKMMPMMHHDGGAGGPHRLARSPRQRLRQPAMTIPVYRGVFPVAPTVFDERGELDLEGQKRCVDFMIDAGSDGICILANWSEQFALSDAEREQVMDCVLGHVAGRVPVIVTTTHFATQLCAERSRRAQAAGAAMVMVMPPYHGATIRVPEAGIYDFFRRVADAIGIPLMIQDAPVAGTALSASFLARMAREIGNVGYFKIEVPQAANKLRALIAEGGEAVLGPWDGEEGITLLADLNAGATGAMPGAGYPDGIRSILAAHAAGEREAAAAAYARWLPLINFENRQCGLTLAKVLMEEGRIIRSGATRHPFPPLHPETRAELLEIARRLDPLVLRWAR
jgi:4-hydroxy-tetrahydrodipicolinate synthase